MNEFLVIGDIHGEVNKLKELLAKMPKDKHLVFLGDYINIGRNSKQVIEELILLDDQCECTFLAGNHDLYLLAYLEKKMEFIEYASFGGIPTILSYIDEAKGDVRNQLISSIPITHIDFLKGLHLYMETELYFISHAEVNFTRPYSRDKADLLYNKRYHEQIELVFEKTIICGHFVQSKLKPHISENFICLDTGCGTLNTGVLTAISLPERKVISTN